MRRIFLFVLLGLGTPFAASGQSLLNAAGLGLPMESMDARSRALGGAGIGLQGPALTASDPAAAVGFAFPTVLLTAQPSWVDAGDSEVAADGTFRGTRFPSLGIAYPVRQLGVATVTYESVFDQRYEAERPVTLDLGDGPVEVTDEFVSDGGVSQIRLGFARIVGNRLALGGSVGRYTGSLVRRLTRGFGEDAEVQQIESYQSGGLWKYSGTSLTGGASLAIGRYGQLAASFTWSSALDASPSDDTEGAGRSFDLPLQLRVGATAVLSPGLALSAGMTTADWSGIDDDLASTSSVGRANSLGVGLELTRARLFGRTAPLRLGWRKRDLPFVLEQGAPTETVWTGGMGLHLSQAGEFVRAALDLAAERGTREDDLLSESFWRGTLTVRVSGF